MPRRQVPFPEAAEFGRRVRELRIERGWSQWQLAEAIGVNRTYIGTIELGYRNVGLRTILRFAIVFKVHPASLIEDIETPDWLA